MFIVAQYSGQSSYPYTAFACEDEVDFRSRVISFGLDRGFDSALRIETLDDAIEFLLDKRCSVAFIYQDDYVPGDSTEVDRVAVDLGWARYG